MLVKKYTLAHMQVWSDFMGPHEMPRPLGVTRATMCLHSNSHSLSCDVLYDGAKTQSAVDCGGGNYQHFKHLVMADVKYVCVCVREGETGWKDRFAWPYLERKRERFMNEWWVMVLFAIPFLFLYLPLLLTYEGCMWRW